MLSQAEGGSHIVFDNRNYLNHWLFQTADSGVFPDFSQCTFRKVLPKMTTDQMVSSMILHIIWWRYAGRHWPLCLRISRPRLAKLRSTSTNAFSKTGSSESRKSLCDLFIPTWLTTLSSEETAGVTSFEDDWLSFKSLGRLSEFIFVSRTLFLGITTPLSACNCLTVISRSSTKFQSI